MGLRLRLLRADPQVEPFLLQPTRRLLVFGIVGNPTIFAEPYNDA
jgi:hypothetical protein